MDDSTKENDKAKCKKRILIDNIMVPVWEDDEAAEEINWEELKRKLAEL